MPKKILATPSELKPQPKRGLPRWAWAVAAAAVLFGLAVLVAPFLIPWDKVKAAVVAQGSQALGRQLSIGTIDLGLLSGVQVKDVSLANAKGDFSRQPLFANADAKVSVSLWSLLSGRVVINSIRFVKPTLLLETDRSGRSNLAGLGSGSATAASPKPGPAASPAAASFPVLVNEFVIQQGDVVIRDRQKGTETAIHGLDLKLTGLSLAAAGASRLEASLNAVVQGKTIPVTLVSDFKLDPSTLAVDIRSFTLTLPAVVAHLKGGIQGQASQADLGLDVAVDLGALDQLLPPATLKSLPPDLKLGGSLALALKLKGPLKRPQAMALDGSLDFDKVQAHYGSYPALSGLQGRLSFDKAGADLPALTMNLGGDPLTLALKAHWGDLGNLTGGASKLKADVQVHVTSPKLNLDPLLAAGSGGSPAPAAGGAGKASPAPNGGLADDRALVSKGLTLSFDVDADSVLAQGLKTGKLVERLRLQGQKLATATDLDLYRGHLAERSVVDLGQLGPVYRTQILLKGLDVGPLVDDLAAADPKDLKLQQLKGKVSGSLGLRADVHGKGLAEPARTAHLAGTASFQMTDGVIRKTDLQERLAQAIPDPSTQAVLRGDLRFSNALGELVIAGPKTTLKSFSLGSGKDWRAGVLFAQASGTLVKDGPVDFHITPHLNPAQVHVGGDLGRAFEDSRGWPTFDYVSYAGPTLDQAKADFSAGLKKAATKALGDKVQRLVQDKAGDALKQLPGLNKLFGQ